MKDVRAAIFGCLGGLILFTVMGAWTYTLDTDTPVGTDAPSTIDDQIRLAKDGFQERLNVDHMFGLTGSQVSDLDAGEHRKVTFYTQISTPTNEANKGWLYIKDVSSVAELTWLDESGNELALTSGGTLNIASADLVGTLANDTYFTAVDNAGTGTVNLIKANTSDVAVLPDGSELATSGAPTADADISNKKYVDDSVTAHLNGRNHAFDSLRLVDSESNAFVKDHAYLAGQDGIVIAITTAFANYYIKGYNGGTSDPAGAGYQVASNYSPTNNVLISITFPVQSGTYWEITTNANPPTIYWQPMSVTGGLPVDQD